jgi:ABC-type uncharacterized transport system permease subunit
MSDALKPYAKAVAGLLTPIVLALLAKLAKWVGVDVEFDPTVVGTAVTALVTGVLVYLVRNRPKPAP